MVVHPHDAASALPPRRRSTVRRVLLAGAIGAVLLAPAPANAQDPGDTAQQAVSVAPTRSKEAPASEAARTVRRFLDGRFMIGVSGSHVLTPDSDLGQKWSISPVFRPTPRRYGWAPAVGLNWYSGDIKVEIDGHQTIVGHLRLRPVMAGIGYSIGRGPTRTTLSLVGGYAFNSASAEPALPAGTMASVSITNAWVVRPAVNFTYAVTRRLAIISSVGYVYMNPTVSVAVSTGGQRAFQPPGDYRCDYINFTLGTAFSIF
jgi:hypothetical protein